VCHGSLSQPDLGQPADNEEFAFNPQKGILVPKNTGQYRPSGIGHVNVIPSSSYSSDSKENATAAAGAKTPSPPSSPSHAGGDRNANLTPIDEGQSTSDEAESFSNEQMEVSVDNPSTSASADEVKIAICTNDSTKMCEKLMREHRRVPVEPSEANYIILPPVYKSIPEYEQGAQLRTSYWLVCYNMI